METCELEPREMKIEFTPMHTFISVVEHCPDTGLYVGFVPGIPGAHSQDETLEELNDRLKEVIAMILDEDALLNDR